MPQGITKAGIQGFDNVIKNLNAEILKMTEGSRVGLITAVKFIQRDIEQTEPLTPVDLGNMRDSWQYHRIHEKVGGKTMYGVQFGYYGEWGSYALWVHEMLGAANWSRPGSGPKWLEKSLVRNQDVILQIIASEIK